MKKRRALETVETIGSIAWFVMDGSWLLGARTLALLLAAPTVALSLLVFRYDRPSWPARLVAVAMTSWAIMNILWMTSDFGLLPWGAAVAKAFLFLGATLVALALIMRRTATLAALGARFRRLRVRV